MGALVIAAQGRGLLFSCPQRRIRGALSGLWPRRLVIGRRQRLPFPFTQPTIARGGQLQPGSHNNGGSNDASQRRLAASLRALIDCRVALYPLHARSRYSRCYGLPCR
jgi:hypothetical protein